MQNPRRSKGETFFNQPAPVTDSGQHAVEPIETEVTLQQAFENVASALQNAPAPEVTPEGDKLTFSTRSWAGVKDVFHCNFCGEDRDSKDEIILHIIEHVPEKDRSALLDKLTKEK